MDRLGVVLALLPVVAFGLQYKMSLDRGTDQQMLRHYTVTYIDWVFVLFNFFVARCIDWEKGQVLFAVTAVSLTANTVAHAMWAANPGAGGHMISSAGVMLPAGWVHLVYSSLQGALILAFFFTRNPGVGQMNVDVTACLAITYFITAGISGYLMNKGFILTDVIMVAFGVTVTAASYLFWKGGVITQ
jgi:hypothetical protein